MTTQTITVSENLAKTIKQECGENVYLCYSCKRCSNGCPLAEEMDLTPAQILKSLQFGLIDEVLNSKTIWLCVSCETCSTRCPQGIDLARIMDVLREISISRGIKPKISTVPVFNRVALKTMSRYGRLYELGALVNFNLKIGKPFLGASLGAKMFMKGKIKLTPERAHYPEDLEKLKPQRQKTKVFGYYPGCSLHSTAKEYNLSTQVVCEKLKVKLQEVENWVCCGAGPAHQTSYELATTLPMKNLALAEKQGLTNLTVPCAACYSRLKIAARDVAHNKKLKEKVEGEIGHKFSHEVKVSSLPETFAKEVGQKTIKKKIKKPLEDLKVACYYGCLLTRPPEATGAKDYEYPMQMDELMEAVGAIPVDWSYKTECCGADFSITLTDVILKMIQDILVDAQANGAEAVVVACPLCHANLDLRQEQIAKRLKTKLNIPILYLTQVLGLSFGLPAKQLGLGKHLVSPQDLLRSKRLIR